MIRSENSLADKHSAKSHRCPPSLGVGPDHVAEILATDYQLRALEITELVSFDSKNFAVRAERNIKKQPDDPIDGLGALSSSDHESNLYKMQSLEVELVLKVLNVALCTPERLPIIKKKLECSQFLRQHGFLCPKTVYTSRGERFAKIYQTDSYAVLMTKLPGNILAADPGKLTAVVLLEIGILLADMHGALQNWDRALLQCDPCNPWCLENLHLLSDYLHCIQDDDVCQVLSVIIEQFKQTRVNIFPQIEKGIIHGDFHDWNLIVDWDSQPSLEGSGLLSTLLPVEQSLPDSETWLSSSTNANLDQSKIVKSAVCVHGEVDCKQTPATHPVNKQVSTFAIPTSNIKSIKQKYGIIDFEEVCLSYPVLELCRLVADLMIDCTAVDTFEIGGYIIAGYASVCKETVKEFRSALLSTVKACLAQYVILGTFEFQRQNESNDYCLEGTRGAKALLMKLNDMSSDDVLQVWANILKDYGLADVL